MPTSPDPGNKNFLDRLEIWHNWASDKKAVWFPFLFLMPKPETPILWPRRAAMTVCFAFAFAVFYLLRKKIFGGFLEWSALLEVWLWALAGFFLWFTFVTSFFWNRRARRLVQTPKQRN